MADIASASNITGLTSMRTLPVLQDTVEVNAAMAWSARQRDLIVVDAENRPVRVYNLGEHNLAEAEYYEELRRILLAAANAP